MGGHRNTTILRPLIMSSPVPLSTEYRTNLEHARHGSFQTLDVEHRTDSLYLLDQPPGSTTETNEDEFRRRQTKTDSLWGRAKWQLPYSWRHPRVTKTELDTSSLMRPADSRAPEKCSSLSSPGSTRGTTQVLSFLNLLSAKSKAMKRGQSPKVVSTDLTED